MEKTIRWLDLKYKIDYLARNQKILRELLKRLPNDRELVITDIEPGLGGNFRFLRERIDADQVWYFVEHVNKFSQITIEHLSDIFSTDITYGEQFQLGNTSYQINLLEENYLNNTPTLPESDLITANSLFDGLSEEQFANFIANITADILYFTINYGGMEFTEETETDRYFIKIYESMIDHVSLEGKAMGVSSTNTMSEVLNSQQYDTILGKSDWELTSDDSEIQLLLIDIMADVLDTAGQTTGGDPDLDTWLSATKERIHQNDLTIKVRHDDILAIKQINDN